MKWDNRIAHLVRALVRTHRALELRASRGGVNDLLVRGQRGLEAAAIVAFVAAKRTLLRVHGTLRKNERGNERVWMWKTRLG